MNAVETGITNVEPIILVGHAGRRIHEGADRPAADARQTAEGALKLLARCAEVPVKSMRARRAA